MSRQSGQRTFASFDVDHDRDLFDRLASESNDTGLGISLSGSSKSFTGTDEWNEHTRREIRGVDRVLVICGEFTDASMGVASELRIAREEQKPYLLLWGRRETMCTKPAGARPAEGMYGWTMEIIREQLAVMSRVEEREAAAVGMRRTAPARSGSHATGS